MKIIIETVTTFTDQYETEISDDSTSDNFRDTLRSVVRNMSRRFTVGKMERDHVEATVKVYRGPLNSIEDYDTIYEEKFNR